jgi:hypothetical protein
VRLFARQTWPLTASAIGFDEPTQTVRGDSKLSMLFRLRRMTPWQLPEVERLRRPCRCGSDPFMHPGR